jgi:ABC-type phosphate transport system substrate-binding protein
MKKLLYVFLLVASAQLFSGFAGAQVLVIANPSVKASEVSKGALKDIFTGGSSKLGSSDVTPVLLKAGTVHSEFLAAYIGKDDAAFRAGWRSLVFSGNASMPKNLDSDAAVVAYVAQNSGAIGYIGKASPHEGVKVLTVH